MKLSAYTYITGHVNPLVQPAAYARDELEKREGVESGEWINVRTRITKNAMVSVTLILYVKGYVY